MNITKKLAFILSLIFCVQFSGIITYASNGDGTESNPYRINTADELLWFAGLVNGTLTDGSEKNTSACAILTADIVLNEGNLASSANQANATVWTPIGSEAAAYDGLFDGNGKTITGIYVTAGTHRGMFGYVTGTVKNLNLANTYIDGDSCQYIAGIAGYLSGGNISNCSVSGTNMMKRFSTYQGGIVAYSADNSYIDNCTNNSYLTSNGSMTSCYVGGIVGYNNASIIISCENRYEIYNWAKNSFNGGIACYNTNGGYIIDCHNYDSVSGYNNGYAAGIVAENNASTVSDCTNNGDIHDAPDHTNSIHLGGIAVYNKNGGLITNSANNHPFDVDAGNAAGIVAYVYNSTVENCYNISNISGSWRGSVAGAILSVNDASTVRNCYSTGNVTVSGEQSSGSCSYSSFISGSDSDDNTIENCYYLATEETDTHNGTTFKTAEQFASGEVCYLLNGDQSNIVFHQTIGTDLTPTFDGLQVYYSEANGYSNTNE